MNEDIKTIIVDENEHIDVVKIDENENIKNVALKTLLKGAPGENGTNIELIPKIYPESIEEDLKPNQVYNGNAIHDLARLFGMTLEPIKAKTIFDVSCTISLTTMKVTNVSHYSKDIIEKRKEGNLVRMNCTFAENPKMNVVVILNVIDGDWVFFYPVIRGDIGQGMKNYVFRLGVGLSNATIEAHDLSGSDVGILTEFDIEYTYEDNEVYNANAIHQLMEIFGREITNIVDLVEQKEDKRTYVEVNINYNPNNNTSSLRNWVTENPYEVVDKENKKGRETMMVAHLYVNNAFFETVYMTQTLYSDNPSWGHFKYWLGFTDDRTMAYLRLNSSGSSTCGIKIFN